MRQFDLLIYNEVPLTNVDAIAEAIGRGLGIFCRKDELNNVLQLVLQAAWLDAVNAGTALIGADHIMGAVCKQVALGIAFILPNRDHIALIGDPNIIRLRAAFFGEDAEELCVNVLFDLAVTGKMRNASILLAAAARDLASRQNDNVVLPHGMDYNIPAEHGEIGRDEFAWRSSGSMLLATSRE